ncbi:hypothetical protein ACP70R_012252 [Stipagrostis hirtigluma subsp. patula]
MRPQGPSEAPEQVVPPQRLQGRDSYPLQSTSRDVVADAWATQRRRHARRRLQRDLDPQGRPLSRHPSILPESGATPEGGENRRGRHLHIEGMFDDEDLGFFANFVGIIIFVLVTAYHFVMADPKYEVN